jgi:6-phospho-beta-glucosidase
MDETLPLEFNIPGQETVGPGGFFFALRSVPQALGLAKQMEVFCPEAVLLNYTNPTNIVTQALCTNSSVTVVGLCDQSDEDMEALAESLGESGLRFECVGLNHATLYSQLRNSRGKSLDLSLAKVPPKAFDEEHKLRFRHCLALAHQAPGCWPNSYLAYYFFPQDFVRLSLEEGPRSQQIMNKMDSYYVHFKEESRKEKPQLRYHRGSAGFGDMAVRVLLALGGVQKQDLVLNLPNETSSSFLRGTILEAKSREFKALPMPEVPSSFQELLKRLERYQWAVAEACLNPSTQNLVRALSENPLIPSKETAEKMLLKAKQTYGSSLPQLQ